MESFKKGETNMSKTKKMIIITVRSEDDLIPYHYDSVDDLRNEWLSDNIDMNVPENDACIESVKVGNDDVTREIPRLISSSGPIIFADVLVYFDIAEPEHFISNVSEKESNPYYEIALIEKPGNEGLTRNEMLDLFDMLSRPEAYPIEIGDINGNSTAIGFITPQAAEELQQEYGQDSELGRFISSILNDIDKESEDGTYTFKDLRIWLTR